MAAIDFLEQAIALEPEYAPAYASLASVYAYCWFFDVLPSVETAAKWLTATKRVLLLDPDLDEAHGIMARFHFYYERNWDAAEREFLKALQLNSVNAEIWQQYSVFLAVVGRKEKAIECAGKALELDPLSLMNNLQAGWVFLFGGDTERVLAICRRMLEMEPNFHGAYWQIGLVHISKNEFEQALEAFQKSFALAPTPNMLSHIGAIYGDLDKNEEAAAVADQLIELRKQQPVAAYHIARVYSRMGELDKAFEWLDTSLQENDGELAFLNVHIRPNEPGTFGMAIRRDPRFEKVLQRVGLPQ